ncbi:MAG: ABC transporter substrate-binding protein [Hyphomicrobiaceae bacterium]|nr:ABC transporter substrate-binding protein [Hyphomicrobiaceae bacterium]
MHGAPLYGPDFTHFAYANPDAPKGGTLTFGVLGSFDTLNPLIVRGTPNWWVRGLVHESLMARGRDEAFTLYGLLAEGVEVAEDRSSVTFTLNADARFSDGEPVKTSDLIFSVETLRAKGRPNHRATYARVARMEETGERALRLVFEDAGDRELPLIMGLMPVLPAHALTAETFDRTTLEPPLGSGAYRVAEVEPGQRVIFERNPDYWGQDIPAMRGHFNAERIVYEYFRTETTMFEAFKAGVFDIFPESDPARWTAGYDFPAVTSGDVVKEGFSDGLPKRPDGFVFNTRRAVFSDVRVREALVQLFDFEWINTSMFHGLYERTQGYFSGSELSAVGRSASDSERTLLAPFPDAVRSDVLEGTWQLPVSDGSGRDRALLSEAFRLLAAAGYSFDGGQMSGPDGQPLAFEFLASNREQERLALAYKSSLDLLGIDMTIRTVDSAQYQERLRRFDFDMIQYGWFQSLSPGNEQRTRFSPESADVEGSFNMAGIREPAVAAMIEALLAADTREAFVDAARALDRVLISGTYLVPHYHAPQSWVARRARIRHPETTSLFGYFTDTWWVME